MATLRADDRDELRALAMRYARGVDRNDAEVFGSAFARNAQMQTYAPKTDEPVTLYDGRDAIVTIPDKVAAAYDTTFHVVHQGEYTATDAGAVGEVYCTASHFLADPAAGESSSAVFVMYIRYHDTYTVDAEGRWLIERREVHTDWTERRS